MNRSPTAKELATIKAMLLTKSYTAQQIADAVGRSRGSVCGIVWRYPDLKEIGFPTQKNNTAARKASKREQERDKLKLRMGVEDGRDMFYGKWMLPGPKNLVQLASHHCRFPVEGEGEDMLFCAAERVRESSYCEFHRKKCVVAAIGRVA